VKDPYLKPMRKIKTLKFFSPDGDRVKSYKIPIVLPRNQGELLFSRNSSSRLIKGEKERGKLG